MTYTKLQDEKRENVFTFTIDVSADEFAAAVNKAYEQTKGKYSVQGFRKGKVPKKFLENMYGKGVFYDDALDILLQESYDEILQKEKLEPVERPDVDIVKAGGDGAQFSIVVTTLKEVKLGQYKGLKIKKSDIKTTDEDVRRELERTRENAARIFSVDDRPAKKGDTVVLDFSGSVNGEKFKGGTAEKHELVLGSGSFIPGFEEQVEGLKIGEEKDVSVKFPDDYHAEDLKGKDAVFAVKLHEIKVKELPEIDDEFAKDVSEFETLAEYKADIKKKLDEKNDEKNKSIDENSLIERIVEGSDAYVPSTFVERECESLIRQFEYRLVFQGLKMKDYLAYSGQTGDDLKAQYKESAEKNVKTRMVMEKLIETENIKLDTEKLDEKIAELAKNAGKTVEEYKANADSGELDYFANDLLTNALFTFLRENNEFI
ncbi:MAG: trigger factor [Clostridiales bacterium]|jgi:trigger factor|nr:trigger factor [Clostridiales bacterium]